MNAFLDSYVYADTLLALCEGRHFLGREMKSIMIIFQNICSLLSSASSSFLCFRDGLKLASCVYDCVFTFRVRS
jgi:hypothetical protein